MAINNNNLIPEKTGQRVRSFTRFFSGNTWYVKHSLNTDKIFVNVLNTQYEMIVPKTIVQTNSNQVNVEFNKPIEGYCSVILQTPLLKTKRFLLTNVTKDEMFRIKLIYEP